MTNRKKNPVGEFNDHAIDVNLALDRDDEVSPIVGMLSNFFIANDIPTAASYNVPAFSM